MGWAEEPEADRRIDFHIPQQRADLALTEFAEQADLTLAVPRDVLLGKEANALIGSYTLQEGIDVLLAGTGLIPEFSNQIVLSIKTDPKSVGEGKTMKSPKKATGLAALLASVFAGGVGAEELGTTDEDGEEFSEELEEIIVTGTNIRGQDPAGSPILRFDREYIDKTGFSTAQQLIQSLPQNFNGGAAESTGSLRTGRNDAGLNVGDGAGINLRGLGNDSTLVLLNGRRLAAAGFGNFVDISMIPLTAIGRVDVLTDGASAIYGSDAVGGVVNFVLRDDYDGAETRLRYGTVTEGGLKEYQAAQTFGKNWNGGNALISYEFFSRASLGTQERSFSEGALDPSTLFPAQERHTVFASFGQDLTDSIRVFGTGFYSDREAESSFANIFDTDGTDTDAGSEQIGGTLGLSVEINDNWFAELVSVYNRNESSQRSVDAITSVEDGTNNNEATTWSFDAKIDGELFELPGGAAKLAIGGQYRKEELATLVTGVALPPSLQEPVDSDREVYAFFGELLVPVVGDNNRRPGVERLDISVAGRFEDYSDFGMTTNPKVGVVWSPISDLDIRGSFGTSFRAPLLNELDNSFLQGFLFNAPNPASPSGTTLSLLAFGGPVPDLDPEDATTWTVGADIAPSGIPGLNASITYFDIEFKDRIDSVLAFFDAFTDPTFAAIISQPADQEIIDSIAALPPTFFFNLTASNLSDTEATIDSRTRNLSVTNVNGLDFNISYSQDTDIGNLNFGLNGNYLFKLENQLIETSDPVDIVDTVFNPVGLRLRGNVGWSSDNGLQANAFFNYVDSYADDQVDPAGEIDSWTTVDLTVSYDTSQLRDKAAFLDGLLFSVSVQNLLDQDPPEVMDITSSNVAAGFDPENANALGRFISLQLTKRW